MAYTKTFNHALADAVQSGLSSTPKSLPSWLFYDDEGDRLFQQIMRMPEYYPTRCEYDILKQNKHELLRLFRAPDRSFRLIELGAGDGLKTEILLRHFVENDAPFTYYPVDISGNALDVLTSRLTTTMPGLHIVPQNKTYDEALSDLRDGEENKVILFMGANIGNFTTREALNFLKKLALALQQDDQLLVGFDLKKDPRVILEAYDDPRGLTAEFNLNMLRRLNRELGADFDTNNFSHYPYYDPHTGSTKSFIISMVYQTVQFEAMERAFTFSAWEPIQTEISQKYDMVMIEKLTKLAGLKLTTVFTDPQHYFCDIVARAA